MSWILVLYLVGVPQQGLEDLIRNLGDDSIEVRERATGALLKLGEKARAALERAAETGPDEVKAGAASILKSLNRVREFRLWMIPPTRTTLSGDMTLRQAVESLEEQGGLKTACAEWPEGTFRIEVKDVPFWKALEEVCRASGKRSLVCEAAGPRLIGDRHVEVPSAVDGIFRIHCNGATERRAVNLDTGVEEKSFVISLQLGFENPKAPFRFYVALDSVKDDLGNEMAVGFLPFLRMAQKYEQLFGADKPLQALTLELKTLQTPKPEVARIASLSGSITVFFRASEETIRIPLPAAMEEHVPVLECFEDSEAKPAIGTATVSPGSRVGDEISSRLKFKSVDSRLLCEFGDPWTLRDAADKTVSGYPGMVASNDPQAPELHISFQNAGKMGEIKSLEVGVPNRLIKKEIRFVLKDIRIK